MKCTQDANSYAKNIMNVHHCYTTTHIHTCKFIKNYFLKRFLAPDNHLDRVKKKVHSPLIRSRIQFLG